MKNQKKWLLVSLCCLFMVLFFHVSSALAAFRVEITATALNVRAGASTAYEKIAQVEKGEQFTAVAEKDGWYQITLADGTKGWVLALYAKVVGQDFPEYIKIAGGVVNIRSGPATSYAIVGSFTQTMVLPVLALQDDWYQVRMTDNKTGWVASWLVQASVSGESSGTDDSGSDTSTDGQQRAAVDSDTLKLRKSANNDGTVVATLSQGTRMTLLDRTGDWYYVRTETGQVGYVPFLYIRYLDAYTSSVAEGASSAKQMFWSGSGEPASSASVSFQEVASGLDITFTSAGHLAYQIKQLSAGNGITISTDAALSGTLPSGVLSGYLAKISWAGSGNSGLQIEWQKELYYKVEESTDGKSLVMHIGPSPLIGQLIVLDPGHGSYKTATSTDVGAVGATGLKESDVVLDIAKKTKKLLTDAGATVVCTREGNTYLGLEERAWVANANNADLFISIHINSFTTSAAKGTSTWIYAPVGDESYDRSARLCLANCLQENLVSILGLANYGIREERFVVVREASMPSALIETAFISNPDEEKLLATDAFRAKVAQAITEGLADYFKETN